MLEPLGRAISLTDSAGKALAHELTLMDNCTLQMQAPRLLVAECWQVRGLQPERESVASVPVFHLLVQLVSPPFWIYEVTFPCQFASKSAAQKLPIGLL